MIRIKRVYELPSADDGYRVLVDRLWPRGLTRESAAIDSWMKDLAPSSTLRTWFAHEPARWPEFMERYRKELAAPLVADLLAELRAHAKAKSVTLLYAAKDEHKNNAVVLLEMLSGS